MNVFACRLLRQDLVANLSASTLQFSEAGGVRSLQHSKDRGGRFTARGRGGKDEVTMFGYRNVCIEVVHFARYAGSYFQVKSYERILCVYNFVPYSDLGQQLYFASIT